MLLQTLFKSVHRIFALAFALILAFPPIFDRFGRTEGLIVSLSLVILYSVRAFFALGGGDVKYQRIIGPNQFFQFAEIPMICLALWLGLNFLPPWLAFPYEKLLLWSTPLFVLLEGFSAIIIVLECGERCSQALVKFCIFS